MGDDEIVVRREEPTPFPPAMNRVFRKFIRDARTALGSQNAEIVLIIATPDTERHTMQVKQASTCGRENAVVLMSSLVAVARNA